MTRIVTTVVAALLATVALAGGLPGRATIAVVNDSGRLVGTGSVHDATLEIALVDPTAAFVTLLVTDAAGAVSGVQGVIALDGSLHVAGAGGILPAASFAADNALAFEFHRYSSVEVRGAGRMAPPTEKASEDGTEALD